MTERIDLAGLNEKESAAVFLAVLAFPERTDWRFDFMMAARAAFKQDKISARKIAAIDRVSKRIAERMKAVNIARPVMAQAGMKSVGIKFRLKGRNSRPYKPTIYKQAEATAGGDGYGNLLGRAWTQTKPVLHLALAFDNHAPEGKTVLGLIRNPEWVRPAVKASAVFAMAVRKHIPSAGQLIELRQ